MELKVISHPVMLSLVICWFLAEGDNITADARVIEEYGLRTNNATLTGEAIPARKTADPSHQTGISELDQPNLIFAGTSIASGTGRAVVYLHRDDDPIRTDRPPDPIHRRRTDSISKGIESSSAKSPHGWRC